MVSLIKITYILCIILFFQLLDGVYWYEKLYGENTKAFIAFCKIMICKYYNFDEEKIKTLTDDSVLLFSIDPIRKKIVSEAKIFLDVVIKDY